MHRILTDHVGRRVAAPENPSRIISLVPSHTETLCDLGLESKIVGITKFCVNPPHLRSNVSVIGGTKQVNIDKIVSLRPNIIFANKEENTVEIVTALEQIAPVWVTDVVSIEDNNKMILDFGKLVNCEPKANEIVSAIESGVANLQYDADLNKPTALYLIWKRPFMAAGQATFINLMLSLAGFDNIISVPRYPEIDFENLDATPDVILLSSEPYPFTQKDVDDISKSFPGTKILLVDGEMFSWHGSRVVKALDYFARLRAEIK